MEGSIVETGNKINEQVGMGYLVKSVNFLGEYYNKLTEVCIQSKLARWYIVQISKVRMEDRVLEEPYQMDCNPMIQRWDNLELIPPDIQKKRAPRNVKKIMDQWYSCAERSQSQNIRDFFTL